MFKHSRANISIFLLHYFFNDKYFDKLHFFLNKDLMRKLVMRIMLAK